MPEKEEEKQRSIFKQALLATVGMPVEAAIKKFQTDLTEEEAGYLRNLKEEDILRIRETENQLQAALGESGDGCGIYN